MRVLLVAVLGVVAVSSLACLIWYLGTRVAPHQDNGGPLTWAFVASALPAAVGMHRFTRQWKRRNPRVPAAVLLCVQPLAACAAVLIAQTTGIAVTLTALSFPMFGASFGWQAAGGPEHNLRAHPPRSGAPPSAP
jgi:hypothetical protein